MSKTETVRQFKTAQAVEAEAQLKAQALADATAVEMEELARSMHTVTNKMCEVMHGIEQQAKSSSDCLKGTAKAIADTAGQMCETALAWGRTADRMRLQQAGQSRRLLVIAVLSAAVGAVSAGLLNHYWPASSSRPSVPQVMIDTDQLAAQIINKWRQYQAASANGS